MRDSRGWFISGDWEPRFYSRIVESPTGCWVWTGSRGPKGYGRFHFNGKGHRAHRFAYERLVGPIGSLTLDHLCRNRLCVNPAHLEPVTNRENLLRGKGLTARNAQVTRCPQGHPYDEANTYRWSRERALARRQAERV